MPVVEFKGAMFTWEFETSVGMVGLNSIGLSSFLKHFSELDKRLPVQEFEFKKQPDPSNKYDYKIEYQDGREWIQTLEFVGAYYAQTLQTFNIPDAFNLDEFINNRPLRDSTDILHREHNVTRITITRLP